MIYAVYRCLYGEDFIQESINSIIDHVDRVFVFYTNKPWGFSSSVVYKGKKIEFPAKFDSIVEKIIELDDPKIILIDQGEYYQEQPWNLFTSLINNVVIPQYGKPDYFILPDVDHVFDEEQIELSLEQFIEQGWVCGKSRQIEVWKGFKHRVPERKKHRTGTVFWNMSTIDYLPQTRACGEPAENSSLENKTLDFFVYNLGFAVSPKVMYWKHLTCISFSKDVNECLPNEDWLDEKWLSWDYKLNNKNLEISKGFEHLIPSAIQYDYYLLPESIKLKIKECDNE